MKVIITYTISLLLLVLSFFSQGADKPADQTIDSKSEQITKPYIALNLHSKILQEQRKLLINLPKQYETSNKDYPVLFLLDGNRHFFHSLASTSTLIEEQRMPESIIVAILNGQGTRNRDLAQQSEQFLAFLKQELLPLIDDMYRTTDIRTLFGHSLAGYFTINTLFTEPELFSHYIAASPVLHVNKKQALTNYKEKSNSGWSSEKALYLSLGNSHAEGKRASQAFDEFTELLQEKPIHQLHSYTQKMPNQVHMTTPNLTLYQGLTHAFSDYAMPIISLQQVEKGEWGLTELKHYYLNRANKYQIQAEVPERAYRRLGFAQQDTEQSKQALETLKENVKHHNDSPRALDALARIYQETNHPKLALSTYQQALNLESVRSSKRNLQYFERQVKKLTSEIKEQ